MKTKHTLHTFIDFLDTLDEKKISYELGKIRDGAILVTVVVPGEIWEIEFNTYGIEDHCEVEISKYKRESSCEIYDESELEVLFNDFVD